MLNCCFQFNECVKCNLTAVTLEVRNTGINMIDIIQALNVTLKLMKWNMIS